MKDIRLAIDIGASSGRLIIGCFDNENRLTSLEEVYRFSNFIDKENDELVWDVERLFNEVKSGIKIALSKYPTINSMSIDTWGVDYVLLDKEDTIIKPVHAYRSNRTLDVIDEVHQLVSFEELYKITGTQFQQFNTIYQLFKDKKCGRLDDAYEFLMIPEYLMFKLTLKKAKEYTNASTTGLLDIKNKEYSKEIINKLGLNERLFNKISTPGEFLGDFTKEIQKELGGNIPVYLAATHDTGSAVAGIKIGNNVPYISSGTWSLLGVKLEEAITSNKAREFNYSNETGPNYIRFQKNIMGLWIVQQLAKQHNLTFIQMVKLAEESDYKEIFNVNDERFLNTDDMSAEILSYFQEKKIKGPRHLKDLINSSYHSLAYSYHEAIKELEEILNQEYEEIYIVGGGAKNRYLNKLTEEYTNKKVVALPMEATSLGNLFTQRRGK